jgi:hypothetical protein
VIRRSALVLVFVLAALASHSRPARAESNAEPRRVVLLVEHEQDPFLERVGAELAGLGFELVRSDTPSALEDAARGAGAVAAIRVLPSRKGVEVWMSDATSGRSLLRQVIVDESQQGPNQGLVALQTAELLRTSLSAEPEPEPEPRPQPQPQPPAAPQPSAELSPPRNELRLPVEPQIDAGLQAALGMLYSPGGGSSALEAGLSLHRSIARHWGLALDLGVPVRSASLSGLEGSTSVGTYLLGGGVFRRFAGASTPLFATAGLGAALLYVTFQGDTHSPLVSSSDGAFTMATYLRGELGLQPATWLRLGVRGLAGASATRVKVQFAGNEAGSWGGGLLAAFALAEVPWH